MLRYVVVLVILFSSLRSNAQLISRIPPEKPKLIVGIIVDQMRYDFLYKYLDKFGDGGFKRLLNEGTNCRNANYNYLFTQTTTGHATIATGTYPSYHGIVADQWYVRLQDKVTDAVRDEKESTIGGSYDAGRMSPRQLLTTTIGDEMRLSSFMKSKVVGVSLEGKDAILSTGQTANEVYWFDDVNGDWVTSSFYMKDLPQWVKDFNAKKLSNLYMGQTWETKLPLENYLDRCLPDDNQYETGLEGKKALPYNLAEMGIIDRKKKKYSLLKYTPFGNTYTKDMAIAAVVNDSLGRDDYPDLLMVSFSSMENICDNFGPESIELMDAYIRLDADLAHFFDFLDQEFGKQNILVFLTSDHGVAQNPQYLSDHGIPVGYFSQIAATSLLKSYLNASYGKGDWVKSYYAQQLYLNHDLIEDSKLSLTDVQQKAARFLLQFSGVANTVTATTLQTNYFPSGVFSKMQHSFNQKRSGDVLINLEPGWIEKNDEVFTHNSSYSYDTHVPLLWYGWKIKRSTDNDPVDIIDIAPTISYFLNITQPDASVGQPIKSLLGQ